MVKQTGRGRKDGSELTLSQEEFCRLLAFPDENGRFSTLNEAYREAYPNWNGSYKSTVRECLDLKKVPHVAKRLAQLKEDYYQELAEQASVGIAVQAWRIIEKQKRHELLMQIVRARAAGTPGLARRIEDLENEIANCENDETRKSLEYKLDTLMSDFGAGEDTGLICRDYKNVGEIVKAVFKLDKALLDAMLDLEESVAAELGQKKPAKIDLTHDIAAGGILDQRLTESVDRIYGDKEPQSD